MLPRARRSQARKSTSSQVVASLQLAVLIIGGASFAQTPPPADPRYATAEAVVKELYKLVCVAPGQKTDWEQVRALYIPEAVIVLRTSKTENTVFSVQGWIDDFAAWDEKANVIERGFEEKIVAMKTTEFRDIAHILVRYEARITSSDKPPTVGVDSIELIRKDGRWWIAAITNDLPTPEHPVPAVIAD